MKHFITAITAILILTACGSGKALQGNDKPSAHQTTGQGEQNQLNYLRQISDNAIYSKNITASVDFSLEAMGKAINVGGKLQMRRDEVIRITITPFGIMEAGRIEFTPEYVLVVDRINKQYIKATYSDVDFLKANGMDFYTLQALFWNELFMPSKQSVAESDLSAFSVNMQMTADRPITLKAKDLTFNWTTDVARKKISSANITYRKGQPQESSISFSYGDFLPFGSKSFPARNILTFNSSASAAKDKIVLDLKLSRLSDNSNWEARTTVSDKYAKVSAKDVLSKLLGR